LARSALALLSGGLDSTVALWWAREQDYNSLAALAFTYGSREEDVSVQCSANIAAKAGIPIEVIELSALRRIAVGSSALVDREKVLPRGLAVPDEEGTAAVWVPARNLVMLSTAAAYAEARGEDCDLIVGFDEEEARTFPDNSRRFVDNVNKALEDAVFRRTVRVVAPLIDMSKREIVSLGARIGAPMELSSSCYQPRGFRGDRPVHCGTCQSCVLRRQGFLDAGVPDPTIYES